MQQALLEGTGLPVAREEGAHPEGGPPVTSPLWDTPPLCATLSPSLGLFRDRKDMVLVEGPHPCLPHSVESKNSLSTEEGS